MALRVGVISDTHGLLRPEALDFLAGCAHIIHGGDIGSQAILDQLTAIAPVTAVRGNNDRGAWAEAVPETADVHLGGVRIHALHDIGMLDGAAAGARVVVYGHSHKPLAEERGGVLYLNPGSAGPRRFSLPVSVAELMVEEGVPVARIVKLV